MVHEQYRIGDAVECIAFNNAFGNWKAGVVRGKRRAGLRYVGTSWCHGANMTSDSALACMFIMNVFTCFVLKPRCCPDQYVYDIEYPNGRLEVKVGVMRLRRPGTPDRAAVPLSAVEVEVAAAMHRAIGVGVEADDATTLPGGQ